MARVEASSVKLKVRDGGLHVLRVGDERGCMAFLLPRASGQSGCDRLIFMLLREGHALNCGRPLRAERMAECKWFSRSFPPPGRRGGQTLSTVGALEVVLQAQAKLAERETSMREVQPCQLWQAAAWHVDHVASPLETVPRALSQLITLAATLAAIATASVLTTRCHIMSHSPMEAVRVAACHCSAAT